MKVQLVANHENLSELYRKRQPKHFDDAQILYFDDAQAVDYWTT